MFTNFQYIQPHATPEELHTQYRDLCKLHHPDLNRNDPTATARMQQINAEYAAASAAANRTAKPGKTEEEYTDLARVSENIRAAIEAIITLPNLQIEICGLWVWVSGETRPVKDQIKAAGYKWASKKEKWYFAGVPAGGRGNWDMEQIRERYGSAKVSRKDDEQKKNTAPKGLR